MPMFRTAELALASTSPGLVGITMRSAYWCVVPTSAQTPAPSRARGGDVTRRGAVAHIQRQLGHADLAITSVYLRGIDNTEIVHTVHERPAPMIPAHNRLNPSA